MSVNKFLKWSFLLVGIIIMSACNDHKKTEATTAENNTLLFPKGEKQPNDRFSGDVFLTPLLARDKNNDFSLGSVTFEPGARTHWHTHPKGQVLVITEGEGFQQEKGKPAQPIRKGDVINIPADTEHWHGASANSKMVHIALTNYKGEENVIWLDPVTDEEFDEVNNKNN